MENYFVFIGGTVKVGVLIFLLFWLIEEMDSRVESERTKLVILAPLMVSFLLITPVLVILGFGFDAFYPLFFSFVWLAAISLRIVLTKPVRTYPVR